MVKSLLKLRAEANHEKGRKGVKDTKLWLESTTHVTLGYNAYRMTTQCTVLLLNGDRQTFDLFGKFIARDVALYVEVKTYDNVGSQAAAYEEFLGIAYSATAQSMEDGEDLNAEFMWVTTHPFSQSKWPKLATREQIEEVLNGPEKAVLGGKPIDPAILTLVSNRIWLLMLNKRQHELALTKVELAQVGTVIDRSGDF